jgi:uncharacterized protein YndB with AHSA1/START domain
MAEVERIIDASVDRVWAVLEDGWSYANWVVGTSHIRHVERDWPRPGSKLHHTSGLWPFAIRDVTFVRRTEPPQLLVVKPRLWPLGRGVVTMKLAPVDPHRTKVTMGEEFDRGPLRWLMVKVNDLLLHRRNEESLRRLEHIATRR